MEPALDNRDLLAMLDWYREMGADEVLGIEPVDWFARGDKAPGAEFLSRVVGANRPAGLLSDQNQAGSSHAGTSQAVQPASRSAPSSRGASGQPARRFEVVAPDQSLEVARSAAAGAGSLNALQDALLAFDGCGLKATAKNTCFYRGAERARVMIIGEAPGRDEDIKGRPFVGRAGQLLDKMLAAIELSETDVHITNVVYWRPPGNRTPTPQETQVCRPFLERQVGLVEPDVILLLGGAAAKTIFDTTDGIMRLRGKWRDLEIGGRHVKTLATLHPAYLLRTPLAKRLAWRDLLAVRGVL